MTLIVYAVICVCAGGLLFVMAFFGSDYDADADIDVDADFDVDADADIGGMLDKLVIFH